ncbi:MULTISPECIES: universal stress protein [Nitrosomonas]|jgi:nucleotide-binding universal stress UspA family protein|uniref:Nucleotide-binding universal stress protein, UspA family n=2 Tax=Nitrosomonas oligotropha TaxID=42354 RepID=A0A1H8S2C9_9PROT|nr:MULTISPECIES: universal stress protein [Nitrosomonas]MBK7492465.1 universal stress protein [Nitrosomonas sp.]MBP9100410.1 universal stress protein [Nitrosomonas sp.]MBX9637990.1 universal stress protein [Nitrosomonas sp.]MBY0483664.1 universal stress protein [Nitrosomonas sp.]SDX00606.1 Nucleotide-binding universal stress protein, UspA family [Nitrosomonas oligotropha]
MTITLIAFDGSENAMRAIDEIVDTLDTSKLHVHLLNVCEPVQMNEVVFNEDPLLDILSIKKAREEAGMALLTPAKARLESAGIPFDVHVRTGNPAEVIIDLSREYHCDLIVMGTRGMGTIKNLLLGSVASKVIHLTEKPLLLVK